MSIRKPKSPELRAYEKKLAECKEIGCIVCGGAWHVLHHRWPKSQGGPDTPDNLRPVCSPHHGMYHASHCGGVYLAQGVEDRVRNFLRFLQDIGADVNTMVNLMGQPADKKRPRPWDMAPSWLQQEVADYMLLDVYKDYSKGRLSNIPKVEEFPVREHLR